MARRRSSLNRTLNLLMIVAMLVSLAVVTMPASAAPDSPGQVTYLHITPAPNYYVQPGGEINLSVSSNPDAFGPGYVIWYLGANEIARDRVTYPLHDWDKALAIPAGTAEGVYDLSVQAYIDTQLAPDWWRWIATSAVRVDGTAPVVKQNALIYPNGGESLIVGNNLTIEWDISMISDAVVPGLPPFPYSGDLGFKPVQLFWSTQNGDPGTWFVISDLLPLDNARSGNHGRYFTHVFGPPCTNTCRVMIVVTDRAGNSSSDMSNEAFTTRVVDSTAPNQVELTAPLDGAIISGNAYSVTAIATDPESGINWVDFSWSYDGIDWKTIARDSVEPFAVPLDTTTIAQCSYIQVQAYAVNGAGGTKYDINQNILVENMPPEVTLLEPEDGSYVRGTVQVKYTLYEQCSGIVSHEVMVSKDGGTTWISLGSGTWNPYRHYYQLDSVTIPNQEYTSLIKVVATNGAGFTGESATHTVYVDNIKPHLLNTTLKAPNGGEFFNIGDQTTIRWQASDIFDGDALQDQPVSLWLSWDGCNGPWHPIATALDNTGEYPWTVASRPTYQACVKLEVTDKAGNEAFDTSDNVFTIGGEDLSLPDVAIVSPEPDVWVEGRIDVKATASDAQSLIDQVEFFWTLTPGNAASWASIGVAHWPDWHGLWKVYDFDTSVVPDGSKLYLKAVATNGVGGQNAAMVAVNVDNSEADVEVQQPPSGLIPAVSGDYELQAYAFDDDSFVTRVSFYWWPGSPNFGGGHGMVGHHRDPIATLTTESVAGQHLYRFTWDTRTVDDGCGFIVAAAENASGLVGVDFSDGILCIRNTASIPLLRGWNLISLPLIPDHTAIGTVLGDLIASGTVDMVATYVRPIKIWKMWSPGGPSNLTEMRDGVGYWIHMNQDDELVIHGYQLPKAGGSMPQYPVYTDWNLIGFKSLFAAYYGDYLGGAVSGLMAQMYYYVAQPGGTGYYVPVSNFAGDPFMRPGNGYWLAVSGNSTIYP